jgi:lysophospholipase L1-like esterase
VINSINSEGLRDDEESLSDPSIVMFGDSFTMGWGIEQDKSFPQLLEIMTNEKVLNAGVSSFGTAREMILMKELNLKNVKTVIIQYHANDYEENETFEKNNYILPIRKQASYDSLKKNITDRSRYTPFKYTSGISRSFVRSMISSKPEPIVNDTLEAKAFLNIIQRSELDKIASHVIVFKIGSDNKNDNNFVNAVDYWLTKDQYAALNITTVRLADLMSKDDYFILDDHINEKGHEKIAARLYKFIKESTNPIFAAGNY